MPFDSWTAYSVAAPGAKASEVTERIGIAVPPAPARAG
jgi:hypothetical protein